MHKIKLDREALYTVLCICTICALVYNPTSMKFQPECIMTSEKIAIPSNSPGGLDSLMSDHFGHCDLFTMVTMQGKEVLAVSTVNNVAHGPGGCLAPIGLLVERGVHSIVVSGMGKRPLAGFQKAGINVFWTARSPKPTIQELIEDLCNSKRQPMELTQSCKGQGDCHGN